jgi:enamine deaminase RidA (YjgF/YER057c/UK114 family)
MTTRGEKALQAVLTVIAAAGLALDAYVHLNLASAFADVKTSVMSKADVFRIDAVVALIAAVALLVRPRRWTAGFAFLVAAAGTIAVVLYRYVDLGAIGPFPNMYDPYWGPAKKAISAFAEGAAALAALGLFVMFHIRARNEERDRTVQVSG